MVISAVFLRFCDFLLEWTEQNSGHHKALVNSGCGISGFLSGLPSISISCIVSFEYFCPFNINIMHHRQKRQYCCFPFTVAHKNNIKDIIGLLDLWLSLSPMDYLKSWANHLQNYLKLKNTVEQKQGRFKENKAWKLSTSKRFYWHWSTQYSSPLFTVHWETFDRNRDDEYECI